MLYYRVVIRTEYIVKDGYDADLGRFDTEKEAQEHINSLFLSGEYCESDLSELYIEESEYEEEVLDVPPNDYD